MTRDRGADPVAAGRNKRANRGSVLLLTLVFAIALALTAASILALSANTYKLSMRNQFRAEATVLAESELEYVFYQFKAAVLSGKNAAAVPTILAGSADVVPEDPSADQLATALAGAAVRTPFLKKYKDAGWQVRRATQLFKTDRGRIPEAETNKVGVFTYIVCWVEVIPPDSSPFRSTGTLRVGRRFINQNATIFQYSMFFQGDLELNPGSDTVVNGDIVANGSIYMAPVAGQELKITGKVSYLKDHYFNQKEGSTADVFWNPLAPVTGTPFAAPTFGTSKESQLNGMDAPENLLGGLDAAATAKAQPELFGPEGKTDSSKWTAADLEEAENNVYRSLIVPPPSAAGSTEYPNSPTADDEVIAVRRAYNRANLILTVGSDGSITFEKVIDGGEPEVVTDTYKHVLTNFAVDPGDGTTPPPTYSAPVYDEREQKTIATTEINIGQLANSLQTAGLNGLLYINLQNSSSTTPGAVRLVNATDLSPVATTGLSIATNGGVYVKGSYNTQTITDPDGTVRPVPAMLMGDSITVLSDGWTDSTVSRPLEQRIASSPTAVNAGLLTGNRSSTSGKSSGGAQNLVRYEEDWRGLEVNFYGSLGRLFQSKHYVAPYGGVGSIYEVPNRVFSFDSNLQNNRPPGAPETTQFSRGTFFKW